MKFSAVTVACLATGVYARIAEPPTRVLERDLATVTGVINTAGEDIDSLTTTVKGFSGDSKPVEDGAAKLISDLNAGKTKVDGSDKLALQDALGLTNPVQDLQKKGQALADGLHDKKSDIEKAGLCDKTRELVGNINTASKALISAVVGKVPDEAQSIAKTLADGLTQVLNKAQDDFSESNCQNSGGSGSSSAASSAPASTGGSGSGSSTAASAPASTGGSGGSGSKTTAAATGTAAPTVTRPSQPTGTGAPTKATTAGPVVTAGAALIAPAGALAMAVAVMMV